MSPSKYTTHTLLYTEKGEHYTLCWGARLDTKHYYLHAHEHTSIYVYKNRRHYLWKIIHP